MHRDGTEITVLRFSEYYNYFHREDYSFPGHSHEKWEINVILSGEMEITYNDRILSLREGMLLICEPGCYHRNRVLSKGGVRQLVFQFFTDSLPLCGKPRIYQMDDYDRSLIHLLSRECETPPCTEADGQHINRRINEPATRLLELFLLKLTADETITHYLTAPDALLFRTAVRFLEQNLSLPLSIDAIAAHCKVSPTKLKRIFAAYTGTGVISHFGTMKIRAAKELLKNGNTVREVSDRLGFSSQAYFSLCFKKATGIPPKEFRKKFIEKT